MQRFYFFSTVHSVDIASVSSEETVEAQSKSVVPTAAAKPAVESASEVEGEKKDEATPIKLTSVKAPRISPLPSTLRFLSYSIPHD